MLAMLTAMFRRTRQVPLRDGVKSWVGTKAVDPAGDGFGSRRETADLERALRQNVVNGDALTMERDTSFTGTAVLDADEETERIVSAIKSMPCHY